MTSTVETTAVDGDDLLRDAAWMAARIHKSVDWVVRNTSRLPHVKVGRSTWFTERLTREWLMEQAVRPSTGQTARSKARRKGRAA